MFHEIMGDEDIDGQDVYDGEGNDADAILAGADYFRQLDGRNHGGPQEWQDFERGVFGNGAPRGNNDQWATGFHDYGGHFAVVQLGQRGGYGAARRQGRYERQHRYQPYDQSASHHRYQMDPNMTLSEALDTN